MFLLALFPNQYRAAKAAPIVGENKVVIRRS
jgi:hypothetical protein